jgi:hypothetical protein
MNWSRIIRRFAAIAVASAVGALVVGAFAGEAWTWSDRLGFGAFLSALAVGAVTMVWGHRMHQL